MRMINMYSIRKQFYTAVGLFSFFLLCGFISPFLNTDTSNNSNKEVDYTIVPTNASHDLKNGELEITVHKGTPPYKIILYSTTIAPKEFQIEKNLSIKNLGAGQYMVVVSDRENTFKSKTVSLNNN